MKRLLPLLWLPLFAAALLVRPSEMPQAERRSGPGALVPVVLGEGWWAATTCGSTPTTWLNVTPDLAVPDSLLGMVLVHEADHRRMMASFGSCDAFRAWMAADPHHRVELEASGFCESARWLYAHHEQPSLLSAVVEESRSFAWYFWQGDVQAAQAEIWKFCGPRAP